MKVWTNETQPLVSIQFDTSYCASLGIDESSSVINTRLNDCFNRTGEFLIKEPDRNTLLAREVPFPARIVIINESYGQVRVADNFQSSNWMDEGSSGKFTEIRS